jgi:hypothetical protein
MLLRGGVCGGVSLEVSTEETLSRSRQRERESILLCLATEKQNKITIY